jgi:hypothetical protein
MAVAWVTSSSEVNVSSRSGRVDSKAVVVLQMMDEMVRQVEVRAAHMQEQKAEYIRVMGSYATLQEHLAAADSDRQRLEGEKGQLLTEIERVEKEHKKSEQILKVVRFSGCMPCYLISRSVQRLTF